MFTKPVTMENEMSKSKQTNRNSDVFIIESNIPIPPIKTKPRTSKYDFLKKMENGQSTVVSDEKKAQRVYVAAKKYGIKVTQRKMEDGSVRIWRDDDKA